MTGGCSSCTCTLACGLVGLEPSSAYGGGLRARLLLWRCSRPRLLKATTTTCGCGGAHAQRQCSPARVKRRQRRGLYARGVPSRPQRLGTVHARSSMAASAVRPVRPSVHGRSGGGGATPAYQAATVARLRAGATTTAVFLRDLFFLFFLCVFAQVIDRFTFGDFKSAAISCDIPSIFVLVLCRLQYGMKIQRFERKITFLLCELLKEQR